MRMKSRVVLLAALARELLDKYESGAYANIEEYSTEIGADKAKLREEVEKYREKIKALDIVE